MTNLLSTPWSRARDSLGLPRTASSCPLVNAVNQHLLGRDVRKCDVLVNVILVSVTGQVRKVGSAAWGSTSRQHTSSGWSHPELVAPVCQRSRKHHHHGRPAGCKSTPGPCHPTKCWWGRAHHVQHSQSQTPRCVVDAHVCVIWVCAWLEEGVRVWVWVGVGAYVYMPRVWPQHARGCAAAQHSACVQTVCVCVCARQACLCAGRCVCGWCDLGAGAGGRGHQPPVSAVALASRLHR
jgi:hypothetical protein